MTAEQLVVLVLIVAAFIAGWVARGGGGAEEAEAEAVAPEPGGDARPPVPRADPVADADRAITLASAAYEKAVDRWLDERDAITPAGRAAVGEVERAAQRLDAASARLDELDHPLADAAWDALDALREAVRHLGAFRDGRVLDAATSRALDRVEDDLAEARAAFERTAA